MCKLSGGPETVNSHAELYCLAKMKTKSLELDSGNRLLEREADGQGKHKTASLLEQ